jgi:hypothetical protein
MPSKKDSVRHSTAADTTEAVDAFMNTLVHTHKAEVQALRKAILSADRQISEGVKWNAPSFRKHEYFGTVNLREKNGISVILHLGAKVRTAGVKKLEIPDPEKQLQWLAPDRAMIRFADGHAFDAKRSAFVRLVRAWIAHV